MIGRATLAALNVPLAHRVRQLELALEHPRGLPDVGTRPFIGINIPSFRLWAWYPAAPAGALTSMRVENLVTLAHWTLKGQPSWTHERVLAAMAGASPLRADLTRPLPVVIFHMTAMVMPAAPRDEIARISRTGRLPGPYAACVHVYEVRGSVVADAA